MKVFIFTKNRLIIFALIFIFVITLTSLGVRAASGVFSTSSKSSIPIYSVETSKKVASLTFDAAWGNEDTYKLIDILAKYNIKATFFVVGDWVDRFPDSVRQLSDAGHEIANHSNDHDKMTELTAQQIKEDVKKCDAKIEKVTGVHPTLFRAPYGEYDDKVVNTVNAMGHYVIQWSVDSLDWQGISTNDMVERVVSKVKNGSILLFHNAVKNTPEALPLIIERLKHDGYSFAPVSSLIYKDGFSIDPTGRQQKSK